MNKVHFSDYLFLHFVFIIYSIVSLLEKTASRYILLSSGFMLCFAGMILMTGLYAFLWQKALNRFPLVVAYSNKGVVIIWTMILGAVIYSETITFNNILGAAIIIAGITLVSRND